MRARGDTINQIPLYPLRFEPIYQYRLWGGRHLAALLTAPLPSGPVGEAWILSDRDDHASQVADGPLKGRAVAQLLEQFPEQFAGGRDREDRSMGRATCRDRKPHLCGPEAGHNCGRSAASDHKRACNKRPSYGSLRSPATPFSCRLGRFTLWAATSWYSRFSRTAT